MRPWLITSLIDWNLAGDIEVLGEEARAWCGEGSHSYIFSGCWLFDGINLNQLLLRLYHWWLWVFKWVIPLPLRLMLVLGKWALIYQVKDQVHLLEYTERSNASGVWRHWASRVWRSSASGGALWFGFQYMKEIPTGPVGWDYLVH